MSRHAALRWRLSAALTSLLLARASTVHAQAVTQRLELRSALGSLSVREDLLVPYAFTGPLLDVALSYGIGKGAHVLELSLDWGVAPLWTRASDFGFAERHALAATYLVQVLERSDRSAWVGLVARASHELASLESWDDAHAYWLDAIALGVSARHAERAGRRATLELRGDVALLGVASRPPARRLNKQDALNKGRYHFDRIGHDPELAYVGDPLLLRLEALLRFRRGAQSFGSGWGVGVETRFGRARTPEPYTSWYSGLVASYGWSFP